MTGPVMDYGELLARAAEFLPAADDRPKPAQVTPIEAITAAAELRARAGEFTPPPDVPEPVLSRDELLARAKPFLANEPAYVDPGPVIAAEGKVRADAEPFLSGLAQLPVQHDGAVADDVSTHTDEPHTAQPTERAEQP